MTSRRPRGGKREVKKVEKELVISNKLGLHARPAALFVQTANKYEASIEIYKDDIRVDGKSIMGIMTLAAEMGSVIRVVAGGKDAETAMDALTKLIETNFGE